MRPWTTGATCLLLALLAASCGRTEAFSYEVHYTNFSAYDDEREGAALAKCLRQDGARLHSTNLSDPPIPEVVFKGSDGDRERFEQCLRVLPRTRVEGPTRFGETG